MPSRRIVVVSVKRMISLSLWVTNTMLTPSAFSLAIMPPSMSISAADKEDVGSSMKISPALVESARAISTSCA